MSEDKKKEVIEVKGLGEVEVVRAATADKPGVFSMSQKALDQFYENHGIAEAKKVFKAIDEAREQFAEAAVDFLAPYVKENRMDYELRAGSGNGRHIVSIDAEKDVRNVATGEVTKKYAVVGFKIVNKAPTNNKMINKIHDELEAALKPAGL